ncbi:CRAL-TRIO domain-containing protein [Gorgonomyces haynaldii]|nr:CRAL-TRIO domain-containing protein [Gorgonomyces haynaldii]
MAVSESEQKSYIAKLKEAIEKEGKYDPQRHDDYLFLRFLRARKFDIEKSTKMLLDYENWRAEMQVDDIVASFAFPESAKVAEIYPRYYHKTDKMGRPIYIERLEYLDCKKLFEITTQERLIKKVIRDYEVLINYRFKCCSVKAGRHIEQGCTILDLKGVPLSQFNQVRKVIQSVSSIASNYYPETMGKMFIINAPTIFAAVWSIIKGMLDENTVAKISVLGSNYKSQLLEVIDEKSLPTYFGGSSNAPEGTDMGPWNDGTVPGYPQEFWEGMAKRDK